METDYREEKLLVNIGDVAGESRLLFNDVILTGKINVLFLSNLIQKFKYFNLVVQLSSHLLHHQPVMTNTVLAQRWFRTVIRSTSKNSVAPPATQVYSALFLTSEFFDR